MHALAPQGFAAGLHIRNGAPLIYMTRYPEAWAEHYAAHSYYLRDPVVFWGLGNTGVRRWSEIALPDPFGLLQQAADYGLRYGAVCSFGPVASRSIAGAARLDREFADNELERMADIVERLHAASAPPPELTRAQVEALERVANGDRHAAAAAKLGISESAFKARLQSARLRLGARTTPEALRKAREYRML